MIRVVGSNAAMDRIEVLTHFDLDAVNRSTEVHVVAGGKGLNVARGIRQLGGDVVAYGFLGGFVGNFLRDRCRAHGIIDRHTEIKGETRVCTVLVESDPPRSTVLNEQGPSVEPTEVDALLATISMDSQPGDLVVMSGSLPAGVRESLYREIVEAVQKRGARAIVDTSGAALRGAIGGMPWMLKTNLDELRDVQRGAIDSGDDRTIARAMRELVAGEIEVVVTTLGARGSLVASPDGTWKVSVPSIRAINATGSGDLFLSGFVKATADGLPLWAAVRLGAACSVANALGVRPELPEGIDLDVIAAQVTIEAAG